MRLLFFDIDGVLNSDDYAMTLDHKMAIDGNGDFPDIDKKCVERLNRIVEETNCELVLSSGWRFFPNIKEYLKEQGFKINIFAVTPCGYSRGHEILVCLNAISNLVETKIESYAILDDNDLNINKYHDGHFIQTAFEHGLTDEDADKVIEILKTNNNNN